MATTATAPAPGTDVPSIFAPPSVPPPQSRKTTGEEGEEEDFDLPLLILDHAASQTPSCKDDFLYWLRQAICTHGNFYLVNALPNDLVEKIHSFAEPLFNLPDDVKNTVLVDKSPHFFGYTPRGEAATEGLVDNREAFDFGPDLTSTWKEGDPLYKKLRPGPNLWPKESALPGFKEAVLEYNKKMTELALEYSRLIAEALGLAPDAFDKFYDEDVRKGGRIKFLKYPPSDKPSLGVGPHRDLWLTFFSYVNDVPGFEIRTESGMSVPIPTFPGVLLVQVGSALEHATHDAVLATPHRVLSPPAGSEPRLAVGYFMDISPDVKFRDLMEGVIPVGGEEKFPEEVRKIAEARRARRVKGFDKVKKLVAGVKAFSLGSQTTASQS
ncbi:hypothetical protein HK102_002605, partial [Quaeritorhiza haematococci]